jgi:uncharacterized membrane protein
MVIVNLLMRWLHIFSVITAVGATVFLRLALFPALAAVADETRKAVIQSLSSRLRVLIHASIGGILLSGFYNTRLLSKTGVPPYGVVYTVKMAVSLTVFVIAILITSGKPRYSGFQANWERWLGLNLTLAVIIVALSAWLRYLH